MQNDSSFISDLEKSRLEETYSYRKRILERAFTENRVPNDPKEIEAINSVLNAIDKSVYDMANSRLKMKENQNKSEVVAAVAEALKKISSSKDTTINKNKITELGDEYTPLDIVKGEMDIGPAQLTIDEILNSKD